MFVECVVSTHFHDHRRFRASFWPNAKWTSAKFSKEETIDKCDRQYHQKVLTQQNIAKLWCCCLQQTRFGHTFTALISCKPVFDWKLHPCGSCLLNDNLLKFVSGNTFNIIDFHSESILKHHFLKHRCWIYSTGQMYATTLARWESRLSRWVTDLVRRV